MLREAGSGVRQMVERAFARAGVPMRVALEIAGVEGVKEAGAGGHGHRLRLGHVDAARGPRAVSPVAQPGAAHATAVDSGAACECAVAGGGSNFSLCVWPTGLESVGVGGETSVLLEALPRQSLVAGLPAQGR